ncbi:MAG: response regulator transcription factor [Actinomycetota bacterium]|nr:response regulator transcription factor [Actinomycetota bacterium]
MTPVPAISLVVADHHVLYRAALRAALDTKPDLTVVGEAADAPAAVSEVQRPRPDVVLLDVSLGEVDGVPTCAAVKSVAPDTRVLVTSDSADGGALMAAMEAGADGYETKDVDLARLVETIRRVHRGEAVVPPRMLGSLLRALIDRNRETDHALELFMNLTRREKEVLELLVDGCDHEAVADILVISPQTARTHIQNVISKLGVHSRLEAAALAIRHGLVDRLPARRK